MEKQPNETLLALRKKDLEITELLKNYQKLVTENEVLREKYLEKEYKSKRMEEELVVFKQKVKQFQSICGSSKNIDLPNEHLKIKEELRKTKENFRSSRLEYEEKINLLENQLELQKSESDSKISELTEKISLNLQEKSKKHDLGEEFLKKIQEQFGEIQKLKKELENCQDELAVVRQENLILIEENLKHNERKKFVEDVKIEGEILKLLQSSRECFRRAFDLKNRPVFFEEIRQGSNAFEMIKECRALISELMQEIIEVQAESVSGEACSTQ